MTNSEFYTTFYWSLAIAGVVVLIAAALLIAILLVARSILSHAREALEVAEQIAEDTAVIWKLDDTNHVAEEILATVESIESHGARIVDALHQPQRIPR
jgi:urease gamma subunit